MTAPGDRLGPYTVIGRLGSGGMGEVWRASAPDGAVVALKILPDGAPGDEPARRRFAREVASVRRVDDPHVAAVLDAGPDHVPPWVATELVDGPTLAERVAEHGPLAGADLRSFARGLAEGLAAIHAAGVVHRDLSPTNVVVGPGGPVIVDFGVAWYPDASTVTQAGAVVGTPAWMAPEQLGDDAPTDASDVWSWGLVVAFAATGRPPVTGSRPEVVMSRVLAGQVEVDDLPGWLDPLVASCLQRSSARRPTADELVAGLRGGGGSSAATTVVGGTAPDAPTRVGRPTAAGADGASDRAGRPPWSRIAARGSVLVGGLVIGLLAAPLVIVLAVAVAAVAAAALRIWAQERAGDARPLVGGGTVAAGALVMAGAGLSRAFGVVGAVVAVVVLVVVLVLLGGEL